MGYKASNDKSDQSNCGQVNGNTPKSSKQLAAVKFLENAATEMVDRDSGYPGSVKVRVCAPISARASNGNTRAMEPTAITWWQGLGARIATYRTAGPGNEPFVTRN